MPRSRAKRRAQQGSPLRPEAAGRHWKLAYLLPGLLALFLYLPTLGFGLTFDDELQLEDLVDENRTSLRDAWTKPYWGTGRAGGLYRPVLSTSFRIEEAARAPNAVRHGVNVLLHVAVTLLAVRLGFLLGFGALSAGLFGALFAAHPVHVEAVAGLVGRAELLAALFLLAALLLHGREKGAKGFVLALALSFLAAGSKESAWALPAFAIALDLGVGRPWMRAWHAYAGYAAGIAMHLALRRSVLGGWLNAPDVVILPHDNALVALHGFERFLGGLRAAGLNFGHLLYPITLSPDYSGPQTPVTGGLGDPRLWGGVLLLAGSLALIVWGARAKGKTAIFAGALWLLVSAFLVMNVAFTIGTVLADRVLYFPSLAFLLVVVGLATRARGRIVPGILALLVVGYAARAVAYLPAWRDSEHLFEAALESTPRVPRMWHNRGRAHSMAGDLKQAASCFQKAIELDPTHVPSWTHLAATLRQLGAIGEAVRAGDEAVRLSPHDADALIASGAAHLEARTLAVAKTRFLEAAARDPERSDPPYHLALIAQAESRFPEAADLWRRCLALEPNSADAKAALASILATRLARAPEGEALAREAALADPANPAYQLVLAEALFRQGKRAEAVAAARQAEALGGGAEAAARAKRYAEEAVPVEP